MLSKYRLIHCFYVYLLDIKKWHMSKKRSKTCNLLAIGLVIFLMRWLSEDLYLMVPGI